MRIGGIGFQGRSLIGRCIFFYMMNKKLVLWSEINDMNKIVICSAALLNPEGDLLMVRKKGSSYFQLPGGKIGPGENREQTLARELKEELQFDVSEKELKFIGSHATQAINELNTVVEGYIYLISLAECRDFAAYEELEEVVWISRQDWQSYRLAHLASEFVIPKWLSGDFDE
jgi:NTP pyrophosphohydrolases including oxidative damage repair enzymes